MLNISSGAHLLTIARLRCALLFAVVAFCSATPARTEIKSKPRRAAHPPPNPSQVGQWVTGFNWGTVVHASVLPNGKVLYWSQFPFPPTYARLWCGVVDNTTCFNTTMPVPVYYDQTYLFCSGHSLLPDGRMFVSGGSMFDAPNEGTPKTTLFDPATNTWTAGPLMLHGRWYPTNVALGNGETLIASGTFCINQQNPKVNNCYWGYAVNNIPDVLNSSGTALRSLTNATLQLPLYPWLHVGSDGRVFYAGPNSPARWLDTTGNGTWGTTERPYYYAHDMPPLTDRSEGSSVMYDVDKVLIAGGGDNPPSRTAEKINLAGEGHWVMTGSMYYARRHHNLTILADGKVVATGGSSGSGFNNVCPASEVKPAEIWNPADNTWYLMAAANNARFYHSTAMLLVDGRVLVGGSTPWGRPNIDPCWVDAVYETEIFSPPYLFNPDGTTATRPIIGAAPTNITYGQPFNVTTTNGMTIGKITMVRLSSVTHSVNMNQRFNQLTFQQAGANLQVNPPANGNACPPGHYMLFIINSAGVPSMAKIVQIS